MIKIAGFSILTPVILDCFFKKIVLKGYLDLMFFNNGFIFYWIVLIQVKVLAG
jgi:cytochrome c oxidase assembly factor CtaG